MSVEGGPSGGGIGGAVASVGVELASPTTFFESNMNIVSIIKAADVVMGPPVMVGIGSPILQQVEAVASAAWNKPWDYFPSEKKFEVPKVFHSALADVNLDPAQTIAVPAEAETPLVFNPAQLFFENNVRILSIMPIFSPQPEPQASELNAADAVSEAESILSEAARPQIIIPQPMPKPEIGVIFRPEPVTKTDPALAAQIITQPQVETGVSSRTAHVIYAPVIEEQAVEEVVNGKKELFEKDSDDQTEVKNSQECSLLKVKIVEDVQASKIRKGEISAAIKRLGGIGKIGRLIAKLLTVRFWLSKSQLVGDKKDWTIDLTAHSIVSDETEYQSPEEAERALVGVVDKHIPVKQGEAGRGATVDEVRKVIHGEGREELQAKASIPAEIVVKRIIEKRVAVENGIELVLESKVDTYSEPNIADLGLEQVLTDSNNLG